MPLTNAFREAVTSGKVQRVRIMMKDSMLVDPTFSEFNEMKNEATNMQDLYDEHDGRPLNYDEESWDDSYMSELRVQIVGNFSQERVEHLKKVVKKLRPAQVSTHDEPIANRKNTGINTANEKSKSTNSTNRNQSSRHDIDKGKKVVGGVIIGAVVGGVVAGAISVSVVGGATVGAVAGAVTVSCIMNGD